MKKGSILFVLCICACSERGYYEAIHTSQRNQCEQLAGSQRDDCFRHLGPDYQTYERQRQELLIDEKKDKNKKEGEVAE